MFVQIISRRYKFQAYLCILVEKLNWSISFPNKRGHIILHRKISSETWSNSQNMCLISLNLQVRCIAHYLTALYKYPSVPQGLVCTWFKSDYICELKFTKKTTWGTIFAFKFRSQLKMTKVSPWKDIESYI